MASAGFASLKASLLSPREVVQYIPLKVRVRTRIQNYPNGKCPYCTRTPPEYKSPHKERRGADGASVGQHTCARVRAAFSSTRKKRSARELLLQKP